MKYTMNAKNHTKSKIERNYPLFFAYKIYDSECKINKRKSKNVKCKSFIFFICNKCSKHFTNFSHLKRHVLQVEFKKTNKCPNCKKFVKRIDEHRKFCKFYYPSNALFSNQFNKEKPIYKKYLSTNKVFDLNSIVEKIIEEYKSKYDYNIIKDKYILFCDNLIGSGSYGEVLFGAKLDDNSALAIKIQKDNIDKDTIENEMNVLKSFPKNLPFPNFFYREVSENGNLMIESLVGPTIEKLYQFCDSSFDIATICNIGIDLINCFEILHGLGYVHNDIKSDNVAILLQDRNKEKYGISCTLIDFGKSKKFDTSDDQKKKLNENKIGNGNIKYSSYNVLIGGKIGPKDDLESLCYFLLKYFNNNLPWFNYDMDDKKNYKQFVIDAKKNFDIKKYCNNKYNELIEIFNDIKNLDFKERPKYSKYKNLFLKIIKNNTSSNIDNMRFKWQKSFYQVMKEFKENNNYQVLNDSIKLLFNGIPEQIGFSFLDQYYN